MAGKWFIKVLIERGGSDSECSDAIYGRVINVSPLEVQILSLVIIDDNLIVLGKYIGSFSMNGSLMTTEEGEGRDEEKSKTKKITKLITFTSDSFLKVGDRVTMIRADDGQ